MSFDAPILKIGPIKYGDTQEYTLFFKNDGAFDFKMFHLEGGCDCTEPLEWTKSAVKPGEKGMIRFKFDSSKASVSDAYNSSLNIYGNVPDDLIIYEIEAKVTE